MKQNLIRLSGQYVTALRKYLKQGPQASLQPALELGRQAVAIGVETLELARIHEHALATLNLSNTKNALTRLAVGFFGEVNALIEQTHRTAQEGKARLSRTQAVLGLRTEELAASNCELQRGTARGKALAVAAEKNGQHYKKSLQESLQLQKQLRKLTHRVMAAQEDERTKISHELQDEIAQTLLGINVRLLSLKQKSRGATRGFRDEIASTQQLVLKSARFVRQFARELKAPHPA